MTGWTGGRSVLKMTPVMTADDPPTSLSGPPSDWTCCHSTEASDAARMSPSPTGDKQVRQKRLIVAGAETESRDSSTRDTPTAGSRGGSEINGIVSAPHRSSGP